jgi:hypothetical protein
VRHAIAAAHLDRTEENAIVHPLRRAVFFEAVALSDLPAEFLDHFRAAHLEMRCQTIDLFI